MPWVDAEKFRRTLLEFYLSPYVILVLPSLLANRLLWLGLTAAT